MSQLMDLVASQLDAGTLGKLSGSLGVDQGQVEQVVSGAMPLLVNALARNASDDRGASQLAGALDRDHDGSVLDNLAGFLGNTSNGDSGVLRHVLGNRQSTVEQGLSRMSGLEPSQVSQVLSLLGPVVLGAVSKLRQDRNLDAGGLQQLLGRESEAVQQRDPESMGILGRLIDQDGDGDVSDDIVNIGS